jgi:uncharacterized protein (DUF488 family)
MIEISTIGFTKKNAEKFFSLLNDEGVETIIDTRVNNTSQLSGFAKGGDLKFFAKEIAQIDYFHEIDYAPTKELLKKYRSKDISWDEYEVEYLNLLDLRKIKSKVDIQKLHKGCLLCSEHTAEKCHRRLLAEYLQKSSSEKIIITHLK